jgi:hypothetical protein
MSGDLRGTVTSGLLVWYSNTQNNFSSRVAIFSLHTLASPGGTNVNYDEKQVRTWEKHVWVVSFYRYRGHKYMSYGFPIINFCNPRAHYEIPCVHIHCTFLNTIRTRI